MLQHANEVFNNQGCIAQNNYVIPKAPPTFTIQRPSFIHNNPNQFSSEKVVKSYLLKHEVLSLSNP
jgi:hypothetical protein